MWRDIWNVYWKRLVGALIGLFFGIIYLIVGFWDMLFIAFLVFIGYWFGKQKEFTNGPVFPWQRIWHALLERFRPFR